MLLGYPTRRFDQAAEPGAVVVAAITLPERHLLGIAVEIRAAQVMMVSGHGPAEAAEKGLGAPSSAR